MENTTLMLHSGQWSGGDDEGNERDGKRGKDRTERLHLLLADQLLINETLRWTSVNTTREES